MAPLNIFRQPGEDEAEFQRRYAREKMRIYRARKPKGPPKVRGKGVKPRADAQFTQAQWESLQRRAEETDDEFRRRSNRERMKLWRANNPEKSRAATRKHYNNNLDKERARNARYRAENPEKLKATQKAYLDKHREKRLGALKAWAENNPERYAEIRKRWYDANRELRNFYSGKWRKAARQQTPPWADFDKIKVIYEEAVRISEATGIPHHVDHYYPLQGKTVSGLHVETNLRVIPAVENVRKRNRLPEDV